MSAEFSMFKVNAPRGAFKSASELENNTLKGDSVELRLVKPEEYTGDFEDTMIKRLLLGIPNVPNESRSKVFVECLINQLKEAAEGLSKTTRLDSPQTSEDGVPVELRHQLADLVSTLQWIINSTSWHSGNYHKFDAQEIRRKIEFAAGYSAYGR